jgi:hypothetical protein
MDKTPLAAKPAAEAKQQNSDTRYDEWQGVERFDQAQPEAQCETSTNDQIRCHVGRSHPPHSSIRDRREVYVSRHNGNQAPTMPPPMA